MDFTTKVMLQKPTFSICHSDRLMMLGSCFTENIGSILHTNGFKVDINPFGIMYNPVSLFNSLKRIATADYYTHNDLLFYNDLYLSLDHHGSFSGVDEVQVLELINKRLSDAHQHFKEAKYVLITLGTSFAYKHIERNSIVANCHKIPGTAFNKDLLTIDEILSAYNEVSSFLVDKTVLFTVSPVRHWRDGAVENLRSKSVLIESIHQLIAQYDDIAYFPAYEIMMDELRDYRFYAEDMLHPSAVAIQYIWERFKDAYLSAASMKCLDRIDKLKFLYQHRIKYPDTSAAHAHHIKVEDALLEFKKDYPDIVLNFQN